MFDAVLIANRGEIAVRIARACRELGVRAVAVHSDADAGAPHVRAADESHLLGPAPAAESYLHIERILAAAATAGVDAIHPGYGFLAENADFAQAVVDAGLTFIGPGPEAIAQMGDKLTARAVALAAGVGVVPGTREPTDDPDVARAFGAEHGYPVAVKAMFGGGGRGMKVVRAPEEMDTALQAARREAVAAFGRGECYLERYLERPRHVEIQVLADLDGTTIHLGERDCSLQRRHQKLVEEAPAPGLSNEVRTAMGAAAVKVAREMGYVNAGTCEFLLDGDGETFYFLEMNTRLQVEHPVTEMVTGIDLVHKQLQIASGDGLGLTQDDVQFTGHAIEVRLNAEDPAQGFMPAPGLITELRPPQGPWVRLDTGAESGYEVPRIYDSMIGKLIVWGEDRDVARRRMIRALDELIVRGIPTTASFHALAMQHAQFAAGTHSTMSVETEWDLSELAPFDPDSDRPDEDPLAHHPSGMTSSRRDVQLSISGQPLWVSVHGTVRGRAGVAAVSAQTRQRGARGREGQSADAPELRAPMQGTIIEYAVENGAVVAEGDLVVVIEAMKMETHVKAHRGGTIAAILHGAGDVVEQDAVLATIKRDHVPHPSSP